MQPDQSREPPLRPSTAAHVTRQLCMAIADIVHHELSGEVSRRTYTKLFGLAMAAERYSKEAAHWYGNLLGDDHDLLETLQDRFVAGTESKK